MGLNDRLRALDRRVGATKLGAGMVRARRADEDVASHLRYVALNGGFGANRVAEDVLVLLERLTDLETRVATLEAQK